MLVGYAYTGSFCTISKSIEVMQQMVNAGMEVIPIMSNNAYSIDTRFGKSEKIINQIYNVFSIKNC